MRSSFGHTFGQYLYPLTFTLMEEQGARLMTEITMCAVFRLPYSCAVVSVRCQDSCQRRGRAANDVLQPLESAIRSRTEYQQDDAAVETNIGGYYKPNRVTQSCAVPI